MFEKSDICDPNLEVLMVGLVVMCALTCGYGFHVPIQVLRWDFFPSEDANLSTRCFCVLHRLSLGASTAVVESPLLSRRPMAAPAMSARTSE